MWFMGFFFGQKQKREEWTVSSSLFCQEIKEKEKRLKFLPRVWKKTRGLPLCLFALCFHLFYSCNLILLLK